LTGEKARKNKKKQKKEPEDEAEHVGTNNRKGVDISQSLAG